MANVLNRTTKQYLISVNTPDYDPLQWIINPDLSAVGSFPSIYWTITGNVVTLSNAAARAVVDDNAFIALINSQGLTSYLFGDGDDGPTVISVDTVMTSDIYPTILTVNTGVKLTTNGFNIFPQYGIINLGTIADEGANAAAGVAGAGAPTGTRGGGGSGALGGLLAGAAAANLTGATAPGFGGQGGTGGAGDSGVGGAGGLTRIGQAGTRVRPRRMLNVLAGGEYDATNGFVQYLGGAGGGAGAGDGINPGGSGAGGGGFLGIAAPFIFNGPTGVISVRGGIGFTSVTGNCGGGGGGGGGDMAAACLQLRNRGSLLVTGGAAGLGSGTGTAGTAGNNGRMVLYTVTLF
jgi:hypothetical protein